MLASRIIFKDITGQKFLLKVTRPVGNPVSTFEFGALDSTTVILKLNSKDYQDKVFRYFGLRNPEQCSSAEVVLLKALHRAEEEFVNHIFGLIRIRLENTITENADSILDWIYSTNSNPMIWIYHKLVAYSGEMVESGMYHAHRNILNSRGQQLLRLFDDSIDKLCMLGEIEKEFASYQKENIRRYIKVIG